MTNTLSLRDVTADDLPIFFEQQLDADACSMAVFTAEDPTDFAAFMADWTKTLTDPRTLTKTILFNGQVAGYISVRGLSFQSRIAYWIGKAFWGKGVASQALAQLLDQVAERPLFATVAHDNLASMRVLEKCGFEMCGVTEGFSYLRRMGVVEFVFVLDDPVLTQAATPGWDPAP